MKKFIAVFRILFQDNLNYRAQAVVWILTSVVPAITSGAVWLAAVGNGQLGAFDRSNIILYFLGSLTLSNLVTSSIAWDMGMEIKQGKLSLYLVKPLSYPSYQFLYNLSWRIFRSLLFIPVLALLIIVLNSYVNWGVLYLGIYFWMAVILAHLLSFSISFFIGSWALFLEDMSGISEFFMMANWLLGGAIAPIALMPHTLRDIALNAPFRYTLSYPLEVMLGQTPADSPHFLVGLLWLALFVVLSAIVWVNGIKRYSAVGN